MKSYRKELHYNTKTRRAYVNITPQVKDAVAVEVCLDYTDALRALAVENEPNPAKLKWNC